MVDAQCPVDLRVTVGRVERPSHFVCPTLAFADQVHRSGPGSTLAMSSLAEPSAFTTGRPHGAGVRVPRLHDVHALNDGSPPQPTECCRISLSALRRNIAMMTNLALIALKQLRKQRLQAKEVRGALQSGPQRTNTVS